MTTDADPQPQLNRLHAQVKQLRTALALQGVIVLGLAAFIAWSQLRKPEVLVLERNGHSLRLTPDALLMKGPLGDASLMTATQLQLTNRTDSTISLTHTGGVSVRADKATAKLSALDGGAELVLLSSKSSLGAVRITPTQSRIEIIHPHHGFDVRVDDTGSKMSKLSAAPSDDAAPDPSK